VTRGFDEHPLFYNALQYTKHMKNPLALFCHAPLTHCLRRWTSAVVVCLAFAASTQGAFAQSSVVQEWQPAQTLQRITQTDPHEEIRKLLRQGKHAQAMALVDKGLATNPRDPQMRFWQGFLFEQLGQPELAKPVYLALTQDYPELAEPHNNLGVLYAAQGDYAKAQQALEAALRANPQYAEAQENLGDILVQLARQAYERALAINPKQTALAHKIERLQPTSQRTPTQP
jgi:tetratricopeptide (TPR) repeat protein